MANQSENPISAEVVGNAFVEQYFNHLHSTPELAYKFYQESSLLARPKPDGGMTQATTLEGINDMILSFDYQNCRVQILTIDSQSSFKDGVIVFVVGYLTGSDSVRRKFTQTFFLAPQDKGYFVLNDIFKYVDNEANSVADENTPEVPLASNDESSSVADQPVVSQTAPVEVNNASGKAISALENGRESVAENIVVADNPVGSRQNVAPQVMEAAASNTQKDAPKKSFASVVNALNGNKAPFHVRTPPPKPVERPRAPVMQEALPPRNNNAVEKNNVPAVKAHAIFVANLPMTATVEELEKVFKTFGPIKRDGIQVRSNKQQGTCFGFVEFESASSMQSAVKASPIQYGTHLLPIEERRANNDRGRFSSGRGGYRNDNFRGRENYGRDNPSGGRGNYGGGRGYGRNDLEKRGEYREFSGQPRGNAGRNGEAHQRPYQNGGGKVAGQPVKAVA